MAAYEVHIGAIMLPISPEKITITNKNDEKTVTLLNGEEYNFATASSLSTISFEFLLPYVVYPFARYEDEFQSPYVFLTYLKSIMAKQKVVVFSFRRQVGQSERKLSFSDAEKERSKSDKRRILYNYTTRLDVTIDEMSVIDDANLGFDMKVIIKLKEHKAAKTKVIKAVTEKNFHVVLDRPARVINETEQLLPGETLYNFSRRVTGDGYGISIGSAPIIGKPVRMKAVFPVSAKDDITFRNENGKMVRVVIKPLTRELTK